MFENKFSNCKHEVADIIVRARFAAVSTQVWVAKYFMTIKNSVTSQKGQSVVCGSSLSAQQYRDTVSDVMFT